MESIHPLSRQLIWPAFILAIANGVFLYFLPSLADAWYAWPLRPSINAAALGAGYLAGTLATAIAVFAARDWRSIRPLVPGFILLGVVFTIVTLLHADRFRWGYPLTWLWTAVYAGIPIFAGFVWHLQERGRVADAARTSPFPLVGWISIALGTLMMIAAGVWLIAPAIGNSIWPWALTPLLGRCMATWYAAQGLFLVTSGVTLRRANEIPALHGTVALWSLLLLLLWPLHGIAPSGSLAVWVAFHVFLLIFCGSAAWRAWARMKREGARL